MKAKVFLIALAAALSAGCGDTIHGKSVAEPQVAAFHERLNRAQFDEIYASAGDDFHKAASKEKAVGLFSAIAKKLGSAKSSVLSTWNVSTFNFKTKVVLVEKTDFERGKGTETFTFMVSGDKAELVGYNINSLDMMTK